MVHNDREMKQERKPKRQLRSVDNNLVSTLLDHNPVKDLFDFDQYLIEKIPLKLPMFVSGSSTVSSDCDEYLHDDKELSYDKSKLEKEVVIRDLINEPRSKKRRVHRSRSLKQLRQYIRNDPLSDDTYLQYHNKMEKEEKKMANLDKSFMLSEYDKFSDQLRMLNVGKYRSVMKAEEEGTASKDLMYSFLTNPFDDISKKLQQVTKINDPKDYDELKLKYKLTIRELSEFNKKHLKLKQKELELKTIIGKIDDSDDDDDSTLNCDQLRRKRLRQRNLKHGHICNLILYNCTLIIDPIHPPRVKPN